MNRVDILRHTNVKINIEMLNLAETRIQYDFVFFTILKLSCLKYMKGQRFTIAVTTDDLFTVSAVLVVCYVIQITSLT